MKSHNHNLGSAKFSDMALKSNHTDNRSVQLPDNISKYFATNASAPINVVKNTIDTVIISDDEDCTQLVDTESPYKGLLTEIKNVAINSSIDDESDFKSPKHNFKLPVRKEKTKQRPKKPKNSKTAKQTFLTKLDVNPEHLQLATTLSNSLQTFNNHDENESTNDSSFYSFYPSTQQKIAAIKQNLEQFGFKPSTSGIQAQNRRPVVQFTKKKKRSKFRYTTPILVSRTQEDRDRIIAEKTAAILSANFEDESNRNTTHTNEPRIVFSQKLQSSWNVECSIFQAASLETLSSYYVTSLNIPATSAKCGSLLKNWNNIPGRTSPVIFPGNSSSTLNNDNLNETSTRTVLNRTCMSPELFCSDDELSISKPAKLLEETPLNSNEPTLSQSLLDLSPSKTKNAKQNKTNEVHRSLQHNHTITSAAEACNFSKEAKLVDINKEIPFQDDTETDNRILVYERFKDDSENSGIECFDLTHSSDENEEDNCVDVTHKSPSPGASTILQKSLSFQEASNKNNSSRRSKSFNITDYIHEMLESTLPCPSEQLENQATESQLEKSASSVSGEVNCSGESSISFTDEELDYSSAFALLNTSNNIKEVNHSCLQELIDENVAIQNSFSENKQLATPKTWKYPSEVFSELSEKPTLKIRSKSFDSPLESPTRSKVIGKSIRRSLFDSDALCELESDSLAYGVEDNHASTSKLEDDVVTTPKGRMLIKTANVTPMSNYEGMNSPQILNELSKFGLKPLKRKRGVQMLKYIYESTHPLIEQSVGKGSDEKIVKRRKRESDASNKSDESLNRFQSIANGTSNDGVSVSSTSADVFSGKEGSIEIVGDLMTKSETEEDLIFERKQSAKIPSCRIPLHIVWYNFVSSNSNLRANILQYEPLQLEVLHQSLKELGYKFHIQDLLTFLDKKCITIRTAQSQTRRHVKRKSASSTKKS